MTKKCIQCQTNDAVSDKADYCKECLRLIKDYGRQPRLTSNYLWTSRGRYDT